MSVQLVEMSEAELQEAELLCRELLAVLLVDSHDGAAYTVRLRKAVRAERGAILREMAVRDEELSR